jgi:hypothetical protein
MCCGTKSESRSGLYNPQGLEMNDYVVRKGDTLWGIAGERLGNPTRWQEIAQLNNLENADFLLVGQTLLLPGHTNAGASYGMSRALPEKFVGSSHLEKHPATHVPARAFFFVVADEFNPLTRKLVRKVVFPRELQGNPELVREILNPDRFGIQARGPGSKVSIGRHVLGMTNSRYISASELPMGSPRFSGQRFFIDVNKVKQSGGVIHEADEIARDLSRIAAKTKDPRFLQYIDDIRLKSLGIDKEVLIEGEVMARAVKGSSAMALTRGLQFVQGVGIVMSAYDLGRAGVQSYEKGTIKPIAAESVRQLGGWAAAVAGMKLGTAAGAAFGIATGPGVVLSAGAGALIGGVAGYFGFDWVADHIYEN